MSLDLPLLDLLTVLDELPDLGDFEWWQDHDKTPEAIVVSFRITNGRMLLTYWRSQLHEVIYQTPAASKDEAAQRNSSLFAHYGQGLGWSEILDNGFGKSYRRADGQRYALWSYAMDYTTIGTMAFHEVKW